MSYRNYLEHVIVGVRCGLDRIKGYFGPEDLVEVDASEYYEPFKDNPCFYGGFRPLTKKEFYNKPHEFKKRWANK